MRSDTINRRGRLGADREILSACERIFKSEAVGQAFLYLCRHGACTAWLLEVQLGQPQATAHRVIRDLRALGIVEPILKVPQRRIKRSGPMPKVWGLVGHYSDEEVARAGKSIAVNESVEATVVDMTPDIAGLNGLLDRLEQAIAANFGTPGFLLGRPVENRATAYAELEAYVQGPINSIQRYLKREVERQCYDPWTRKALEDEGEAADPPPVAVKHRWSPTRAADVYAMADAVAKLYGSYGSGPIGGDKAKAWELMGWDPGELEEEK